MHLATMFKEITAFQPHVVIIDPMTRTPAFIRLTHMGLKTYGATPTQQAYELLSRPFMLGFYGDRRPIQHLSDAEEIPGVDGRVNVRFREYYAGVPVRHAPRTRSPLHLPREA